MRAALIESFGQPPTVADLPDPDGDAPLGTMLAAGINPIDLNIAGGENYAFRPKPPYTPGLEGVARRPDGALVYFGRSADLRHGSLAEKVPLDDAQSFVLADDTDPLAAISCGIAGLAAWLSVVDRGRIQEGDKVVVTGATGAAGRLAIQVAKLKGASQIIAMGRSEAGLARARELGATDVVRFHGPMHVHQTELEHLSDGGHDLIIDFTWGFPAMSALMSAAKGARLVQVGNAASVGLGITAADLRARQLDLLGFSIFNEPLDKRERALNELLGHVRSGAVVLDAETVALEDVPHAWKRQATSPGAKLVVSIA